MFLHLFDEIFEILTLIKQAVLIYIHRNRAVKIILREAVIAVQAGYPQKPAYTVISPEGETMQLSDIQKANFAIGPGDIVDVKGNPAPVEAGSLVWGVSDPAILSFTQSPDGLSCEVVAVGPTGHAQVTLSADADLGAGVVTITGVKEIDVVNSQAVAINIADVTPVDQ